MMSATDSKPAPVQSGLRLRPAVLAARQQLAEGREKLRIQHDSGSPGVQVCAHLTELVDELVLGLFRAALEDLDESDAADLESKVVLVAHGGFGRRDIAPYSDVDLMLLHASIADHRVMPLARRLSQDIVDAGLQLGFSTRTQRQACGMALKDATIFTSLAESRRLGGSEELFDKFLARYRRAANRRAQSLIGLADAARRDERRQYGETVFLLEPNIKRSRGGLRDIQLVRWIGFARYGEVDPDNLHRAGALPKDDRDKLKQAREFLLRLRNEMHFHAGKAYDVLDKSEQLRLAALYGYEGDAGLLPVEKFMQEYFHHTSEVRYTASSFLDGARTNSGTMNVISSLFSHRVESDYRVGPLHISATRLGLQKLRGDLAQVFRLMDLANQYDKRIDHRTWEAIRESMADCTAIELSRETCDWFMSILSQTGQLGELLRRLHQLRVLEKIIPGMSHARCLLQFNEYHKYTVDEHSIRAVEAAIDFRNDTGTLGEVYRGIRQKRTLHLALLVHDLGKGYAEDHSDVGLRIADETARRLGLPEREAETLKFLVHKHLLMAHLALRRNSEDESEVLKFAVEVGSPDVLQMLYVLTCADLAAVGPGVLNQWKLNLITDLYYRALRHVAADTPASDTDERLRRRREEVRACVTDRQRREWWDQQIAALPRSYLFGSTPQQIVEELSRLKDLPPNDAVAWGRFREDLKTVEYSIGTYEQITPGVFHKLTGALTSQGLQILSAEIHTLADALVLDRFYVHDLDFSGPPPQQRLDDVNRALVAALKDTTGKPPTFRRLWSARPPLPRAALEQLPTRVRLDNSTSDRYTILDIFAHDRMGLLYAISRTIFELGLSVHVAKIGTYLDQVVDVFYITDQQGRKIEDEHQLTTIRTRLLAAIEETTGQQHL